MVTIDKIVTKTKSKKAADAKETLKKFVSKIEKELEGKDISPEILVDAEISPKDVDFALAESLDRLKPFGENNPEPVFAMRNLLVEDTRIIGNGEKHLKLSLRAQDGTPKIFESIGFYIAKEFAHIKKGDMVDAAFNLQKDEWNGNQRIQLLLVDVKVK